MTPTEQQNAALAVFVECVVEGLNPSLHAHTQPRGGAAAYDVLIGRSDNNGIIHEQIVTVLRIAESHGARAFIHHAQEMCSNCLTRMGTGESCLSIVWPGPSPDGPDPEGVHDDQAKAGRRKPRQEAAR